MPRPDGYAKGLKTYGEIRAAMSWKERALCTLGDILDKVARTPGAPIFPKDAPCHMGNCGVVGMCMLSDLPYAEVAPLYAAQLLPAKRKRWTGGTTVDMHAVTARGLNIEITTATENRKLADIAKDSEGKPGRTLCRIPGHIVVVWDGLIFDQNYPAGATPAEHFSARQTVTFTARTA